MGELPEAAWDNVIRNARLQEPMLFSLETSNSELLATVSNAALVESVKVQSERVREPRLGAMCAQAITELLGEPWAVLHQ